MNAHTRSQPSLEPLEQRPNGPHVRSNIDTSGFYSEMRRRFQDHDRDQVNRCIDTYYSLINALDPAPPDGPWLTLGCGHGEWLRLISEKGRSVTGVDADPSAVAECREHGMAAAESDPLQYLRTIDDQSLAVVTSLHLIERYEFEYCINLVYQIARTLKKGGVVLIESPHPGNLLTATDRFWVDPTHQRLIPPRLMKFVFEYCGLDVAHRLDVNPRPESEHIPLQELELSRRLNHLLYGPQDYAMLARRA